MITFYKKRQTVLVSIAIWVTLISLQTTILWAAPEIGLDQGEEWQTLAFQNQQGFEFLQPPSGPSRSSVWDEVIDGLDFELRILGIYVSQELSDSPANPGNILQIPDDTFTLDVRPDFYLDYRRLRLLAKPRYNMTWSRLERGILIDETDFEVDVFLNEWLAGLQMTDSLFISIGRENLQWGPSKLISPSNPFFRDNGLSNPKTEVRGQGFARLVWVPSTSWSISAIANLTEGADETIADFEPAYALKIDYTGYRKFFSLIPSYREKDRGYLGAYAGWRATDGFLFYAEGTVSRGTNALYPVETTLGGNPIITLEATKDESDDLESLILGGVSYTFQLGPTLSLEYLHNSAGYNDEQIETALEFTSQFDRIFAIIPPNIIQEFIDIDKLLDLNLSRLRKNYVNFQYQHQTIRNVFNMGLQYTYNLDDRSSQLIPVILYELNDSTQLFLVGTHNFGSKDGEFRFLGDASYFGGLQYTF